MRKLLLVLLLTLMQGFTYAQTTNQKSTMDKLMSTKWTSVGFPSMTEFDLEMMTLISTDNPERVLKRRYYLSDEIDPIFNDVMVSKVKNGKYIIYSLMYSGNNERFKVFEIMKLNKSELVIEQVEIRKGTIIRSGLPYVYKAVK